MKRITLLFLTIALCACTFVAKAANETVVLTPNRYEVHYMLGGTTRCSGERSVVYLAAQDGWGLQSTGDPYTFKCELYFSFAFDSSTAGSGKILNVSNSEYTVVYTCYDMSGRAVYTDSEVIYPRTFSRILLQGAAKSQPLSKIVCEIK